MLGLPASTEIKKPLPKTVIFRKFSLTPAAEKAFDADISRITIIHEISPRSVSIPEGKEVDSIFVLLVQLKRREYNEGNLRLLARLIPRRMVFLLTVEDEARLAVVETKVLHTDWQAPDSLTLSLEGLTMDAVWDHMAASIGGLTVREGETLSAAVAERSEIEALQKQIDRLKGKLKKEKQSKKKFEIFQNINALQMKLEGITHGQPVPKN